MSHLDLFVYGSLKPGECNYDVIEPWVVRFCQGTIEGQLYLRSDTGYPTLSVQAESRAQVPGVLVTLREGPEMLRRLDLFEQVPQEYLRVRVAVRHAGGITEAWVYVAAPSQRLADWERIASWPGNLERDPIYLPRPS